MEVRGRCVLCLLFTVLGVHIERGTFHSTGLRAVLDTHGTRLCHFVFGDFQTSLCGCHCEQSGCEQIKFLRALGVLGVFVSHTHRQLQHVVIEAWKTREFSQRVFQLKLNLVSEEIYHSVICLTRCILPPFGFEVARFPSTLLSFLSRNAISSTVKKSKSLCSSLKTMKFRSTLCRCRSEKQTLDNGHGSNGCSLSCSLLELHSLPFSNASIS